MTELAVRTRGLVKRFGDVVAVDGIDLDIRKQIVFGFLGPNGSGKSTLMRMLLGLLTPTAGEIEVLGFEMPRQSDAMRRAAGYMTQQFSLYGDLSTQENLEFVGRIHGLASRSLRSRVAELLDRHDLKDLAKRRAGALSGGERQRLALAAAVLNDPPLLLLDEPTSAVDPQSRRDFWDRLFDLVEAGTTVLVSTHYMDEAERCHQLAILKAGRVAALGQPGPMMEALAGRVIVAEGTALSVLRARLGERADVASVGQLGNRLRVLAIDAAAARAVLADLASTPGITAQADRPSLEDVFVDATLGTAVAPPPVAAAA